MVPAGFMMAAARAPDDEPNLKALVRDAQEMLRTIRPAVEDFRAMMKRLEPDLTAAVKGARARSTTSTRRSRRRTANSLPSC